MAAHETVEIPSSRLKREMARILTEQGYIEGFDEAPGRAPVPRPTRSS
jgi:small subunit ribosomal protein S8